MYSQARTVHRGPGGTCPPKALGGGGTGGGTAIGVSGNVIALYIYFTNGSRSVIADFF